MWSWIFYIAELYREKLLLQIAESSAFFTKDEASDNHPHRSQGAVRRARSNARTSLPADLFPGIFGSCARSLSFAIAFYFLVVYLD